MYPIYKAQSEKIEQLEAEIGRLRSALREARAGLQRVENEIYMNLTISPEKDK